METMLELNLTPIPACLGITRLAVSLVAHRLGFDVESVADIDTAVGEACADAIGYGRQFFAGDAELQVRCAAGSGLFVITVEMQGRVCAPPLARHQGPFPNEQALGKFVLDALMDTVSYRCSHEHGASIRMAKALPSAFTTPAAPGREASLPLVARER